MTIFTGTSGDDSLPAVGQDNSGNDTFYGLAGADYINAGIGDDIAYGGSEVDFIDGGGGDDYLDGGTGADTLIGNFGDDTYIVDNAGDTVTEYSAMDGTDTIYSSVSYTLPQYVERLILTGGFNLSGTGGAGADTIIGNSGANTLTGNAGADFLSGGDGNDVLRGGAGMDVLDGGNGIDAVTYTENEVAVTVNLATGVGSGGSAQGDSYSSIENVNGSTADDTIIGNAAANVLNGWAGKDTLTGGGGADTFAFSQTNHSAVGANADVITDFSHAQGDKIDLSAIDADTTVAGNQAFTFIGTGLYNGDAGELRYTSNGAVTTIAGDVNGDGVSDFHIQLTGSIGLVAADFVL
ncbi:calcium-binding protein [Mycobacterium sp. KBS0706]|uniref:calcium-binding protein n=1 Tax=Mycobacterium sp. KBS0706 TaxID=2578109 RepID=UPI00110FF42A|nr:calcium-binding protein [Mycobacterium sp. KBS0706]TSD88207.1 calcium-binding protein [Mycobacterium sp. KBS0706]